jgi:hypothetical protein
MEGLENKTSVWASRELGRTDLGDSRRTARLVRMAARAAEAPAGKVSEVFAERAELQGAYDFLESPHSSASEVSKAAGLAAAERGARERFVFVAVDGSSLTLTDRAGGKDFGSVGALSQHGRGLKVISALSVSPEGVPLGLLSQVWWSRTEARSQSSKVKRKRNRKRKAHEKETRHWLDAIAEACARAKQAGAALWFELDREGDNQSILLKLHETGHTFTVRGAWDRLIQVAGGDKQYLQRRLTLEAPGGHYMLDVTGGPGRAARQARMVVRWARVELRLRDRWGRKERLLELSVVWTREEATVPAGEKPLDWMLLTNHPVRGLADARHIIFGYTQRWRVEEFHKTWKSGACNVEQTQLRTKAAVTVWATILATVATRIERLKALSRTTPDQPADAELDRHEIRALILLRRQIKARNETIPDSMPSIGQATLWIAQLGGYAGKPSERPGSITIGRGLDRLRPAARLLQALEAEGGRSDQ